MSKIVKVVAAGIAIAAAIPTGGTSLLALGLGISTTAGALIALGATVGASLLSPKPPSAETSPAMFDRLRANIDPRAPRKTAVGITAMQADIR